MSSRACALLLLGFIGSWGCFKTSSTSASPAQPSVAPPAATPAAVAKERIDAELLQNLALLTTGRLPTPDTLRAELEKLQTGSATLESYVDGLLADPRFAQDVGPAVVLQSWALHDVANVENQTFPGYLLQQSPPDAQGRSVLFLREPCEPAKAERVRPWWAPEKEVLICQDSHQPTHFKDPATGWYCDGRSMAEALDEHGYCGCGPQLMRCYPDRTVLRAFAHSLVDEVTRTAGYVIGNDLPLSRLYTMNETFRDRYSELAYRRWRVESGESPDILLQLKDWPLEGQLAPRYESKPGQHAGVLTTEMVVFVETGLRPTFKNIFHKLWCSEPDGSHVATGAMLELARTAANVRAGEGWEQLANRPVCETCHARLDYSMQFFSGFPDVRTAGHYMPERQKTGQGKLFNRDARDGRGEGALLPSQFARMAVQQPEFASCLVQRVGAHVFNHRESGEDRQALREAFARSGTLRSVMKAALLRYARAYAERGSSPSVPEVLQAVAPSVGERIVLRSQLRALVRDHCESCHSGGEPELGQEELPQELVRRMLGSVASGRMPEAPETLEPAVRRTLVAELVAALWSEPAERRRAFDYFSGSMRASPVHHAVRSVELVRERAGGGPRYDWPLIEKWVQEDLTQYTPGFATIVALEALRTCKARGLSGEALDQCLEDASDPEPLINGLHLGRTGP
jgi:mono/diheme cytochrome c family protein